MAEVAAPTEARPFCNGTDFMLWEDRNCARCSRSGQQPDGEYLWGACPLEDALTEACVGSGRIPLALARAYGATVHVQDHWNGVLSHRLLAVDTMDGWRDLLVALPALPSEGEPDIEVRAYCELPQDCEMWRA